MSSLSQGGTTAPIARTRPRRITPGVGREPDGEGFERSLRSPAVAGPAPLFAPLLHAPKSAAAAIPAPRRITRRREGRELPNVIERARMRTSLPPHAAEHQRWDAGRASLAPVRGT